MIRSDLHYITFPDDEKICDCIVSSGHFCRLDRALHPIDNVQECSYFLFEDDKEKISKYCQISVLNQTRDQAVSTDKNFWAITALLPR